MAKFANYDVGGNCNVKYWSGLSGIIPTEISKDPERSKKHIENLLYEQFKGSSFNKPKESWCILPNNAIFLFAQGSEHKKSAHPYAYRLAEVIQELDLGEVKDSGLAPNPLHSMKPGVLFMWIVDRDKLLDWWNKEHKLRSKPIVKPVAEIPKIPQIPAPPIPYKPYLGLDAIKPIVPKRAPRAPRKRKPIVPIEVDLGYLNV